MPREENATSKVQYPGNNTIDESLRLKAQHNLVVQALGGLVLYPVDLSKPDLKILDSATADGYFLRILRQHLKHPESATMIGTDVMTYPPNDATDNTTDTIHFKTQNVLDPWPEEWQNYFDFVDQRTVMANVPGRDTAVDVVRRLIQLVKPGGWIQLVDTGMPNEEISADDTPATKLWKTIGAFVQSTGLDPRQGTRLKELLVSAGGVTNIGSKAAAVVLGKGCAPGLEEDSSIELRGLRDVIGNAIKRMPNPVISYADWIEIADAALQEAEQKGIEMLWHAAWAQRVE